MSATDQEILTSLEDGRWYTVKKQERWFPYKLYASARKDNSKLPDWDRWYITYSGVRHCAQGPFPLTQVQRLIESGNLEPDFVDSDGNIQMWILRGNREPN